ncbi:MAG: hypothetical protein DRR00_22955, partial [Candidatus Parabeggiatoa sp. nov. 3]
YVTHPTLIYWGRQQKHVTGPLHKNLIIGGQQKHVTHPTLIYWGRQQKYVTGPLHLFNYWWATKTRYPPYIKV